MIKIQRKLMVLVLAIIMTVSMENVAMATDTTPDYNRYTREEETEMKVLGEIEVKVNENGIVTYSLTEIGDPVVGNLSGIASTQFSKNFNKSYKNVYAIFVARTSDGSSLNATYTLTFNGRSIDVAVNGEANHYFVGNSVSAGTKTGKLTYKNGDKKPCVFVLQFVGE